MNLDPNKITTDHEQHDLKKVRKEFRQQTQVRRNGHKLWDFDPHSGYLKEIPYPQSTVNLTKELTGETRNPFLEPRQTRKHIAKQQIDDGHMYFQCLNRKNAIRKMNNLGYGVRKAEEKEEKKKA